MNLPHLPALRRGQPYESLERSRSSITAPASRWRASARSTPASSARISAQIGEARAALKKFTVAELIEISAKAGELFLNGTLPLGDKGHTQAADDYVETLSATSGLPHVMVRRNMAKIHYALTNMRTVLNGLTRGLPLDVIDRGYGEQSGAAVSLLPDHERARPRHAEQFAGGEFALAARPSR